MLILTRPPEPPADTFDPLRERLAALIPPVLHPDLDAVWADVIHETAVACLNWFDLGKQDVDRDAYEQGRQDGHRAAGETYCEFLKSVPAGALKGTGLDPDLPQH